MGYALIIFFVGGFWLLLRTTTDQSGGTTQRALASASLPLHRAPLCGAPLCRELGRPVGSAGCASGRATSGRRIGGRRIVSREQRRARIPGMASHFQRPQGPHHRRVTVRRWNTLQEVHPGDHPDPT